MGCDFQIFGSQPNIEIQKRCILFLENLMTEFEKTKDGLYTLIDPEAPISNGTKIIREPKIVFKASSHLSELSKNYSISSSYIKGNLYGIIFIHTSVYSFHVVFDRELNGLLCSVTANDSIYGRLYSAYFGRQINKHDEYLYLLPGSCTRIPTGIVDLYVISEAIHILFVPNLEIRADYDVEICNRIFKEIKFADKLLKAKEEDLPKVITETIKHTQKAYDDLCEKQINQLKSRY